MSNLDSPSSPSFRYPSTTHAGGIQPSALFFHPSRPDQARPPTATSGTSYNAAPPPVFVPEQTELLPLNSIQNSPSNASQDLQDDASLQHHHGNSLPQANRTLFSTPSKRTILKHSREPLLPIGRPSAAPNVIPHQTTLHPHPAAVPRALTGDPPPSTIPSKSGTTATPTTLTPTRRVRHSFERVLSLNRGHSLDSSVPSSPHPSTSHRDFEDSNRLPDEERVEGVAQPSLDIFPRIQINSNYPTSTTKSWQTEILATPTNSAYPTTASPSPFPLLPLNQKSSPRAPLRAVPITPIRRNYEFHPSRNSFFLGGRLLTGGDTPYAFLASFTLVLAIAGLWFGTTCVWWWREKSPAVAAVGAYMCLLCISSMLATAMRDPGILPRNLDPDPPYPATSPSDGGVRAPLPRDLKVRQDVVRVKYCPTCQTYRPPRSSHCKMCDNCVDGCDHHCQWVNNCIGRRNYTSFFVFLTSTTLTLLLVIVTSALNLYFLTQPQGPPDAQAGSDFRGALRRGTGSAVVFCLSVAVIWPVMALFVYHMRLLLLNVTTIEQIRNQAHKTLGAGPAPPNPFSHGTWRRNLLAVICRPEGYSWLDARGVVCEDRRSVNPGVMTG